MASLTDSIEHLAKSLHINAILARRARGATLAAAAAIAKCAPSTLSDFEHRRGRLDDAARVRLAEFYKIAARDLSPDAPIGGYATKKSVSQAEAIVGVVQMLEQIAYSDVDTYVRDEAAISYMRLTRVLEKTASQTTNQGFDKLAGPSTSSAIISKARDAAGPRYNGLQEQLAAGRGLVEIAQTWSGNPPTTTTPIEAEILRLALSQAAETDQARALNLQIKIQALISRMERGEKEVPPDSVMGRLGAGRYPGE